MQDVFIDLGKGEAKETRHVPKIEKIGKDNSLSKFRTALSKYDRTRSDFAVVEGQMNSNIQRVVMLLNALWEKQIDDLYRLLYEEANEYLLGEFNISFSKRD